MRWLGFAAGCLGLGVLAGLRPVTDLDVFWHLRTGERLWTQEGWLAVDTLGTLSAGNPWAYKDIAADLVLYLWAAALGVGALPWLVALLAAALCALLAWPAAGPGGRTAEALSPSRLALALGLGALALGAVQHRMQPRPLLLALLIFTAALPLLERARADARVHGVLRLRAWLGPLACVALAGICHRGVVLIALVVWIQLVGVGIALSLRRRADGLGTWALGVALPAVAMGLALALAPVANPNGTATFSTAVALVGGEAFRRHVTEWQPMPLDQLLRHHGVGLIPLLLAALGLRVAAAGGLQRKEPGGLDPGWRALLPDFALAACLWLLVFDAARWLPYAALASARAAFLCDPLRALTPERRLSASLLLAAAATAFLSFERPGAIAAGIATDRYPDAVVAEARKLGLGEGLCNAYDHGGWLLWWHWPALRPAVDGRADMVYTPDDFEIAIAAEHDAHAFARLDARMRQGGGAGCQWVLAKQVATGRTHAYLEADPAFALVAWSEQAVVFARRTASPAIAGAAFSALTGTPLDAIAYRAGQQARSKPDGWAKAQAELGRMAATHPGSLQVAIARVTLALGAGRDAERDAALQALVMSHPQHPATLQLLQRLAGAASAP